MKNPSMKIPEDIAPKLSPEEVEQLKAQLVEKPPPIEVTDVILDNPSSEVLSLTVNQPKAEVVIARYNTLQMKSDSNKILLHKYERDKNDKHYCTLIEFDPNTKTSKLITLSEADTKEDILHILGYFELSVLVTKSGQLLISNGSVILHQSPIKVKTEYECTSNGITNLSVSRCAEISGDSLLFNEANSNALVTLNLKSLRSAYEGRELSAIRIPQPTAVNHFAVSEFGAVYCISRTGQVWVSAAKPKLVTLKVGDGFAFTCITAVGDKVIVATNDNTNVRTLFVLSQKLTELSKYSEPTENKSADCVHLKPLIRNGRQMIIANNDSAPLSLLLLNDTTLIKLTKLDIDGRIYGISIGTDHIVVCGRSANNTQLLKRLSI